MDPGLIPHVLCLLYRKVESQGIRICRGSTLWQESPGTPAQKALMLPGSLRPGSTFGRVCRAMLSWSRPEGWQVDPAGASVRGKQRGEGRLSVLGTSAWPVSPGFTLQVRGVRRPCLQQEGSESYSTGIYSRAVSSLLTAKDELFQKRL